MAGATFRCVLIGLGLFLWREPQQSADILSPGKKPTANAIMTPGPPLWLYLS